VSNAQYYYFLQVENSLLLLFADESEMVIKGVTMKDLFFTK